MPCAQPNGGQLFAKLSTCLFDPGVQVFVVEGQDEGLGIVQRQSALRRHQRHANCIANDAVYEHDNSLCGGDTLPQCVDRKVLGLAFCFPLERYRGIEARIRIVPPERLIERFLEENLNGSEQTLSPDAVGSGRLSTAKVRLFCGAVFQTSKRQKKLPSQLHRKCDLLLCQRRLDRDAKTEASTCHHRSIFDVQQFDHSRGGCRGRFRDRACPFGLAAAGKALLQSRTKDPCRQSKPPRFGRCPSARDATSIITPGPTRARWPVFEESAAVFAPDGRLLRRSSSRSPRLH